MSFLIDYNYHTHTPRCGHATGTPEEYLQRAVQNGVRYMGFSDHAPFVKEDGSESGYRVPMAQAADYVAELQALREKYRGQVELAIGFEMEYYPDSFERMLEAVRRVGAEYLILGQHYLREEGPGVKHAFEATDNEEELATYVARVTDAMRSGAFTYAAHPDAFCFVGSEAVYREAMGTVCDVSKACNVPLEINCLGIRGGRNYPDPRFWRIAGERQAPVTVGFDAHETADAFDGTSLVTAAQLIETYGLRYVGRPVLRRL